MQSGEVGEQVGRNAGQPVAIESSAKRKHDVTYDNNCDRCPSQVSQAFQLAQVVKGARFDLANVIFFELPASDKHRFIHVVLSDNRSSLRGGSVRRRGRDE